MMLLQGQMYFKIEALRKVQVKEVREFIEPLYMNAEWQFGWDI